MKTHEAKKFLEDNSEAMKLLGEKVKLMNSIKEATVKDLEARQIATKIIEEWILELFQAKMSDIIELTESEDDNLYLRLDKQEESGRTS
jgi:RNA binding exosome subunit